MIFKRHLISAISAITGVLIAYVLSLTTIIPQSISLFFLCFGVGMFIHVFIFDVPDWGRDAARKYVINFEHHEPMTIKEILKAIKIKREEYDEKNIAD